MAPNPLSEWSLAGYREAGGDETVCFTATILRNGKKVGSVRNEGSGGCHLFYWSDRADADAFHALAASRTGYWGKPQDDDQLMENIIEALKAKRWAARVAKKGFPIALVVERLPKESWLLEMNEPEVEMTAVTKEEAVLPTVAKKPCVRWSRLDENGYPVQWILGMQTFPAMVTDPEVSAPA